MEQKQELFSFSQAPPCPIFLTLDRCLVRSCLGASRRLGVRIHDVGAAVAVAEDTVQEVGVMRLAWGWVGMGLECHTKQLAPYKSGSHWRVGALFTPCPLRTNLSAMRGVLVGTC